MVFVPWVVRFVDSTEAARVVRLDLNDDASGIEVADLDPGNTEVQLTLASPEGRDGDVVTGRRRPNRTVSVGLRLLGDSLAWAASMGKIARECDRSHSYLEFHPKGEGSAPAEPVFFVVKSGEIHEVDFENAGAEHWTHTLELLCEPTALGALETVPATIVQDPDTAGAFYFAFPSPKGDVAAPLRVDMSQIHAGYVGWMVSMLHLPGDGRTLATSKVYDLDDTWTLGVDTTATTDVATTTFDTTPGMAVRLSKTIAIEDVPLYGAHRLVLMGMTNALGGVIVRADVGTDGYPLVTGDTVPFDRTDSGTRCTFALDLGVFASPPGYTDEWESGSPPMRVELSAEDLSGTGVDFEWDALVAIPVDLPDAETDAAFWRADDYEESTNEVVLDTESGRGYFLATFTNAQLQEVQAPVAPAVPRGTLPHAHPGAVNVVHLLGGFDPPTSFNFAPTDAVVTFTYHPRYLFVASP